MITRRIILGWLDDLHALSQIDDIDEYLRARNAILAKAIPLCKQSTHTKALAGIMTALLAVDSYIPSEKEANPWERQQREREALAGIRSRIGLLEGSLRKAAKTDRPPALFSFIFLLGGILALASMGSHICSAFRSTGWPSVNGRLLTIGLSERQGSSYAGRMGTRIDSRNYGIAVKYEYRVGNTSYIGDRFSFEPLSEEREYWDEKANLYKVGSLVKVYYDPEEPSSAVLETGQYQRNAIFIVMGLAFLAVGLYFAVGIVRFQFF